MDTWEILVKVVSPTLGGIYFVYKTAEMYFKYCEHKRRSSEATQKVSNEKEASLATQIDVTDEAHLLPRPVIDDAPAPPDFRSLTADEGEALRVFLISLRDSTAYIEMRGLGSDTDIGLERLQVPINDIFTPLYIRCLPETQLAKEQQRVSLVDAINLSPRLLILGDPGSGKSTVLKYIAHFLATEVLTELSSFNSSVPTAPRSSADAASPSCVPLLLSATDLRTALGRKDAVSSSMNTPSIIDPIVACAAENYISPTLQDHACKAFEKLSSQGGLILFIDGLDELPSPETLADVENAVLSFVRRFPNSRVVATSRPAFSRSSSVWPSFIEVTIDAFNEPDIKDFVSRWTSSMLAHLATAQQIEHARSLLAGITQTSHLLQLAGNPVMLTCMAFLHYHRRALPASRAEALEAILQWLIKSRDNTSVSSVRDGSRREQAFRRLAYHMSCSSTGRRNTYGIALAANAIAPIFENCDDTALQFLERERLRSGVIKPASQGDIKFWHLWFQEYLTAKAIASQKDDETGWWAAVLPHLDEPAWKEIISFVPACLFRLGAERVDLFYERLSAASAQVAASEKAKRLALAGQSLRDLQLLGYNPPSTQVWRQFVENTIQELDQHRITVSLEEIYFAWVAYGICGDSRINEWEKTWADIQGGNIIAGAQADHREERSFDQLATPWEHVETFTVRDLQIRKFLITVQEYSEFVQNGGYTDRTFWSNAGWEWIEREQFKSPDRWAEQLAMPNCPVAGVSFYEAQAYANRLNKVFREGHWRYRLLHDVEWEYVARRNSKTRFPWGNTILSGNQAEVNWRGAGLLRRTPVGMFPQSTTEEGVADLFGNVEEWCISNVESTLGRPQGVAILEGITGDGCEIVRGGSAIRPMRLCRPTYRSAVTRGGRYMTVGFRLARDRGPNFENLSKNK